MIMKLHTHAPHESRMCPIDFGVKGQGHGALMIENGFQTITDPVIHLWSWHFMLLLLMSQECVLLISGLKGQGHGALMIENSFRTITDPVIYLWSWNLICSPWVKNVPYWFLGQKVKGKGRGALMIENGFQTITDPVIHLWSWNFMHLLLMSQGCAILISGSKGQRSWGIDDWKWFLDHNWPCNQPMIMKLHVLAPH